ncbi:hypothetical protein VTK73DRAFT_8216 [Phialemonium thermophilum]|uniref:Zn(2)-C6 fungal-type domain-containing protein n=1 Tax=Phialemonium thermophilum TaxID=223376 RepID=A0ABR3W9X4_9PEZI
MFAAPTTAEPRQPGPANSREPSPVAAPVRSSPPSPPPAPLPRRRAPTACRLCRARKTRCDNARPSCGYCLMNRAPCIYPDGHAHARPQPQPPLRPAGQDISNSVLLERIDRLAATVDELSRRVGTGLRTAAAQNHSPTASYLPPPPVEFDDSLALGSQGHDGGAPAADSAFSHDGFGRLAVPELAARTSASESILRWPILAHFQSGHGISSFFFQSFSEDSSTSRPLRSSGANSRASIQEHDMVPLSRQFLARIHIKNPVLDVLEFKKSAREAAECGPGWDSRSCLVLLACALACLAEPYTPSQHVRSPTWTPGSTTATVEEGRTTIGPDDAAATGDAYFAAAMRRLGLLPLTLESIQCYFFAGLYEKFAVRPLSAWTLLQQACVRFQAYLHARTWSAPRDGSRAKSSRHREQRLYWSCVKAEYELRAELQLPTSGLLEFKYPDLFPALSLPPSSDHITLADEFVGAAGETPGFEPAAVEPKRTLAPEEERSWLFYLAEISARKIMDRILGGLYGRGESPWLGNITAVLHQHLAYAEELALWRAHLPRQIQFSDNEVPPNELAFFLKTRYLGCLEWLYRPFLYYMTSSPPPSSSDSSGRTAAPAQQMRQVVAPLAERCLLACRELITVVAQHHRHGGIWVLVRRTFNAAVLLLAGAQLWAERGADGMVPLPDGWQASVQLAISTVRKWEDGAADLVRMRQILQSYFDRMGLCG